MRGVRIAAAAATLAVMAAACGGGSKHATTSTTAKKGSKHSRVTTTTAPKPQFAPLTGLPEAFGAAAKRPALTVKIDNFQASHPQVGIDQADVVYEEVVECSITRLAAIFQSHVPPVIGPVRSVRRTDQALVRPIGGIFVFSGGAPYALQSIATAPVVRFEETAAGSAMYRDSSRPAPHNLFLRGPDIYAKAPDAKGPPPPLFTYRAPKTAPVGGTPVAHVVVGFANGYATTWDWDAASGTWLRSIFGGPDHVANGQRIGAANVVVESVDYINRMGGACGDVGGQANLSGTGDLTVLTGGRAIHGHWSGSDPNKPVVLLDTTGRRIPLAPGTTWVELPKRDMVITLG